MNKMWKKAGWALSAATFLSALAYGGAYYVLDQKVKQQFPNVRMGNMKLFLDGIVLPEIETDQLKLTRIYLHGTPWQLYQRGPDYMNVLKAELKSSAVLSTPMPWPFDENIPLAIDAVTFTMPLLGQEIALLGSAKQDPETPLLMDFESQTRELDLQGQAEIRVHEGHVQMVDIDFEGASLDLPQVQAKRMSGWLSYSYEKDWQLIGELEAGFAVMDQRAFSEVSLKLNGPAILPDATFSGMENQMMVEINRKDAAVTLQKDARIFPMQGEVLNTALLQQIDVTLDKFEQLSTIQKLQQEEAQVIAAQAEKADAEKRLKAKEEQEQATVLAEAVVEPVAIEKPKSVQLPEVRLEDLIGNSALKGFVYSALLSPVKHIDGTWTARGKGGILTYDVRNIPEYFIKLNDYEQSKVLQGALLDFNVRAVTVKGVGDKVQEMTLKGTTAANQPAEIQLSVLALE